MGMGDASDMTKGQQLPGLGLSLIPVAALVALLGTQILIFKGDPHMPLVLATLIAGGVGYFVGCPWKTIENGMVEGIQVAIKAILILMVVGVMIGTWISAGVVPYMIYHGLQILHPSVFLLATCVICCVVSLATGSSWTTAGTVGVALIGVAQGLGVPLPMAAGAIVSGAYFGDKMSPLSDSTNLAPAVAGVELFEHIRHMTYTTVPALIMTLILFGMLGLTHTMGSVQTETLKTIQSTLSGNFDLSHWLLLPPVGVILSVFFRVPALPALLGGTVLGGILAGLVQGEHVSAILKVAQSGYVSESGFESVDELLTRGGMDSMMYTVSLILCALSFGGVMEATGMLARIAQSILRFARGTSRLIIATVMTCFGMNIIAPDQYLSIIVPGRMYREAYKASNLEPKNLSRTLEDAGTLSSPLVPWNTCGAYMWATLGVWPLAYLPYAFLNLLTPLMALFCAITGWGIARTVISPPRPRPGGMD